VNKIKLLIIPLFYLAVNSIASESYQVEAWFKILPKNDNLHTARKIAQRKRLRAKAGDQITILENTGYEFEDNGYVYFELTRKGESSPSGVYFAYRSSIERYIQKEGLKPITKDVGPPKTLDGTDDESLDGYGDDDNQSDICSKLSGKPMRFSEKTEVYHVSGTKRGPDTQNFTNRRAFRFKVRRNPRDTTNCYLYLEGKNPPLVFKTPASRFIKADGRLNVYGMEDKTIEDLDEQTSGERRQKISIPSVTSPDTSSVKRSYCEELAELNEEFWLSPEERIAYTQSSEQIITGRKSSKWKIKSEITSSSQGKCTIVKLTPKGREIEQSQIELEMQPFIDEQGRIKAHPLYDAVQMAQQNISEASKPIEPVVKVQSACVKSEPAMVAKRAQKITYEKCTKETGYLERLLKKGLSKRDLSASDDVKACIRAGLFSNPGKNIYFPYCKGKTESTDELKNKTKPCISNNYVSYAKKLLDDTTSCFENLNTSDLLPLVAAESRFSLNVANTVKASGMFQVTAPLLKDGARLKKVKTIKTEKCKKLKDFAFDGSVTGDMSTCQRTSIPGGTKRTTYFAVAALSKAKAKADKLLDTFGKTKLKASDHEGIKQDLMAMMHNRGINGVSRVFEKFMHKFKAASKSAQRSKRRSGLEKMWDEVGKDKKFSRDTFIKFFSSFMYYERYGSNREDKIAKLVKLKKAYDKKYKKQIIELTRKSRSRNSKVKREAKKELKKITSKMNKIIIKNTSKSLRRSVVGKNFTFDKFFDRLPKIIHRMREYEGGTYALSMSCIQDKIQRDAKSKLGLEVTCGPEAISQERQKQIQKTGNPPRCGHDKLAENLKDTLGSEYAHVK
jgi:hypothetical protein